MIALVAVVVLAIGGGVAAWQLTGHHPHPPAPLAAKSPGSTTQAAPAVPASPAGSATATVSTSPPSPTPSPTASTPGSVAIGPGAAGQAGTARVAGFLAQYFAAINHRDYKAYISLFDSRSQPNPTRQQFLAGYRSTTDSRSTLAGLSPTPAGLAATVTFQSHQDPAISATHTACTSWNITLYLETGGSAYLIGPAPPGYHASARPCR
jgi:hypothetical protein